METAAFPISLAHTGSISHREAAKGNTPIPSKRLPNLIFFFSEFVIRIASSYFGKRKRASQWLLKHS